MRIGNNIFSLKISNELQRSSKSIARALERLSTGKRVNSPKDDVASFALGVRLDSQIRGLYQANRNINSAYGVLQTADAAISTQTDIVQRMRELAVQAASQTLSANERQNLSTELNTLVLEFQRITNQTEFNGQKLIDGSFGSRSIQIGANLNQSFDLELGSLQPSNIFEKTVGTGVFEDPEDFSVGSLPSAVRTADLNGDGILDVASINRDDSTISIALGNGDGSFAKSATLSTGATAYSIRIADFNGDGILDLFNSDVGNQTVSVHLGNGDGTFEDRMTFAAGLSALGAEVGDLNGDGIVDIVTANYSNNDISVLLGNGDGTFQDRTTISSGALPFAVTINDFNNDGILDLASSDSGSGTVSVMLGNGDGTFQARVTYAAGSLGLGLDTADVNADGFIDILSSDSSSGSISVSLGNGDGTFQARVTYAAGSSPGYIAIQDFNGDGILDAVASDAIDESLYILLGNGDGTFQDYRSFSTSGTPAGLPFDISPGDVNGDGALDLVVGNSTSNSVSIMLAITTQVSALSNLNLDSAENASNLIGILDTALDNLNTERTKIGNSLSRLDIIYRSNELSIENNSNAKSLNEDADISLEMAELVRAQILQQAQIAALSQANLNMQLVLDLLRFE